MQRGSNRRNTCRSFVYHPYFERRDSFLVPDGVENEALLVDTAKCMLAMIL